MYQMAHTPVSTMVLISTIYLTKFVYIWRDLSPKWSGTQESQGTFQVSLIKPSLQFSVRAHKYSADQILKNWKH